VAGGQGLFGAGHAAFLYLLAAAVASSLLPAGCRAKRDPSRGHVERGPFEVVHEEEGELAALNTLTISSKTSGQIVFVVKDLTHVEKGDVLVELDKSDLESRLKGTQSELSAVRKELEEKQRGLAIQKAQLEVDLEKKMAAFDLVEVRLETVRRGAEPDDVAIAEKNLEAAGAAMAFAESAFEDARALAEKGFATESELAEEAYDLELSRARFEKARLRLEALRAGPTAHELRPAELAREEAKIELDIARTEVVSGVARLEQSVAWSRAEGSRLEEEVAGITRELEQCSIHAPRAGLALRVWRYWEEDKGDAGMRTWPGIAIVELPDLTAFKVKTQIPESTIRRFKVGDEVPVEIEGLDGEVFAGTVARIDAWARDKNADLAEADQKQEGLSGIRVFKADIALREVDERMKLGSSAEVRLVSVLEDVTFVDRRAVEWREGRPFVRVLAEDGSVKPVPVVLGESNLRSCVIAGGVEAGTPVAFRHGR
jgi:multidrug resistance efflux pump